MNKISIHPQDMQKTLFFIQTVLSFFLLLAAYNTYASAPTSSSAANYESDLDSLPSYTIVTGLPSYDDALEQMRLKINKHETLLKHPPLSSIFEQTTHVDFTSEKCPNISQTTTTTAARATNLSTTQTQNTNYQALQSYQVSVIVPQISEAIKPTKTELYTNTTNRTNSTNATHTRDEQQQVHQQSQLVTELRRLSENHTDSFNINLPIVLPSDGNHCSESPATELGHEISQKPIYDTNKKCKVDNLEKIAEIQARRDIRNCIQ